MEEEDAGPKIQAHQTERKQETRRRSTTKPLKKTFKKATCRSISQCTRSQVAPKWTKKETMILLNEIACQDHELAKALPSNQRWKIVAEGCGRMNINRSSNDCKRRWDSLITERNKIHVWENSESYSKLGSYWSLESSKRKKFQLPASFDEDVLGAIDGVIEVQEALSGSKEPVQVSDEVENDKDSVGTDVNDDNDANDDSDVNYDSDDDSERTTTESESSDLNVRGVRTRATKARKKVAAEIFDTEMTGASLDAVADVDAEAGPDANADAVADADAVAGADTVAVAVAGADADADAVAGAGADADAVAGADANAVAGAGADAVAGADADAVAGADADAVAGASADADAVAGADANAVAGAGADADAVAGADAVTGADSEKKEIETAKVYSKEQEMANKLRENAKQINAILKGELPDDFSKSQIDLTKPNAVESEFVKRQAGELIKNFEVLVSNLNQFNILINEGSCEGINFIKPIGP